MNNENKNLSVAPSLSPYRQTNIKNDNQHYIPSNHHIWVALLSLWPPCYKYSTVQYVPGTWHVLYVPPQVHQSEHHIFTFSTPCLGYHQYYNKQATRMLPPVDTSTPSEDKVQNISSTVSSAWLETRTKSKITSNKRTAEELPLEWTKLKRRTRKQKGRIESNPNSSPDDANYKNDDSDDEGFCCDDGSCWNENHADLQPNTTAARTTTKTTAGSRGTNHLVGEGENLKSNTGNASSDYLTMEGKALFCLHSLDCSWFQGQFINNTGNSTSSRKDAVKSLGLLAKRRTDVDDCLKCSDGGYSEIDLIVLGRDTPDIEDHNNNNHYPKKEETEEMEHQTTRKSMTAKRLICTGGDMLRIRHSSSPTSRDDGITVSFDADQIITGGKVVYLTRRYFPNLLPPSIGLVHDHSVLTNFPDCAIVVGNMSLSVPSNFLLGKKKRT